MSVVQPPAPRYKIEELEDGVKVVIPSSRRWTAIALSSWNLLFAIAFASGFAWSVLRSLANGVQSISSIGDVGSVVVCLVVVGGLAALVLFFTYNLLWEICGREVLLFGPQYLAVRRQVLMLGRTYDYLADQIQDLRAVPDLPRKLGLGVFRGNPWGIRFYSMAFDYGAATVHVGSDISEAEAKQIVNAIHSRLPTLGRSASAP